MHNEFEPLDPNVLWVATEARRRVPTDPAARDRLIHAIRNEPAPRRGLRLISWVSEPSRFALSPLATAALAAGLVGVGVLGGLVLHRDGRQPTEQRPAVAVGHSQLPDSLVPRTVKFVLIAPQAAKVSVVGDFNGWDSAATPMKLQSADGTWTVFVALQPGLHVYSFVVDGAHFVTDPSAPVAPDEGFGHRSSVVLVRGSSL